MCSINMYLYKANCVWQGKERCDWTNTDGSTLCGCLDQREFGDQVVGHNCNGVYIYSREYYYFYIV